MINIMFLFYMPGQKNTSVNFVAVSWRQRTYKFIQLQIYLQQVS